MKIKPRTKYKIAILTFVLMTVLSYIWAVYCIVCWILKQIVL